MVLLLLLLGMMSLLSAGGEIRSVLRSVLAGIRLGEGCSVVSPLLVAGGDEEATSESMEAR